MHWRKSHNTTDLTVCERTQIRLSYRIPSTEQRGKKIVKSQMEQYRTREHRPAEVLRCHSGPHTELQTAYTQYKDEGGHMHQSSAEIGKLGSGAQVQARLEPPRLFCVIPLLNMQHQYGRDLITLTYWIQNSLHA